MSSTAKGKHLCNVVVYSISLRPSVENLNGCHKDIRATYSILSKKGTRQERLQWSAVISTYCIHRACVIVCREGFG